MYAALAQAAVFAENKGLILLAMPLWLSIPVVAALWLSSWISALDVTGSQGDAYLVWSATAVATVLLGVRLARSV
jgi:hypothetical protein